jgi:hypothetical protein
MKIAGHTACVNALFESTPLYFGAYLTEETPEFSVTVTREDIAFEQQDLLEEALREGFKPRTFTDPFLERAAIGRRFAEFLLAHRTLWLHGSAVALDGCGYLFTARSGTGKSTHTRLWREVFGSRAVMINDDKPFVTLNEQGVTIFGSPWSGKHGLDSNIAVPLAGICLLERGAENRIHSVPPEELEALLVKQSHCQPGQESWQAELVRQLVSSVPLWKMECTKDISAAQTAYEAMAGKSCTGFWDVVK